MGDVDEHVEDHGAAVRIGAALPVREVPGALQLFGGDLGQRGDHVVEGLAENFEDRGLIFRGWRGGVELEGWFEVRDLMPFAFVGSAFEWF
jgi:hypothetical protein